MVRSSWHSATRALGLGLASLTLAPLSLLPQAADAATGGSGGSGAASTADAVAVTSSPLKLWAPAKVMAYTYGGKRVWTDLGLRVIAQGAPFELWSTRADSYDGPITTVWRSADGDKTLDPGLMSSFNGLTHFIHVTMTSRRTGEEKVLNKRACLSGWGERVQPDAPATSSYPRGCWYNPFTLGSVQGIQEGWATRILSQNRPMRLPTGKYDVTATIDQTYVDTFGIAAADATRSFTLVVDKGDDGLYRPSTRQGARTAGSDRIAQPAAQEPTAAPTEPASGPRPDLRPVPAWSIRVSRNGHYLQFAATVWNAGDSPLVVDGFRREGDEKMDAYQYFFDKDGNQVGYQPVGQMEWDARQTHHHWHFEDFARYSLVTLNDDGTVDEKVRSKKEAFCLANTDAVDLTVDGADWNPENTDLATSCGDLSALSIREVLASGWGDTYAQYRAGQSFNLQGLTTGTYYVAVTANPEGNLVESDTDNNQVLRRVKLKRHKDGTYSVTVAPVGNVKESSVGY